MAKDTSWFRQLGIAHDPFTLEPVQSPQIFETPDLVGLVDTLIEVAASGHTIALIKGQRGIGKTTLANHFAESLRGRPGIDLLRINCTRDINLVQALAQATGLSDEDLAEEPRKRLFAHLTQLRAGGLRVIAAIDDAHWLSHQNLVLLIRLSLSPDPKKSGLLRTLLFAEPRIEARLASLTENLAVLDRFYMLSLAGYNLDQIAAYLEHRLRAAGFVGDPPFSAADITAIHRDSQGLPASINTLAARHMQQDQPLQRHQPMPTRSRIPLWSAAAIVMVAIVAGLGIWELKRKLPATPSEIAALPKTQQKLPTTSEDKFQTEPQRPPTLVEKDKPTALVESDAEELPTLLEDTQPTQAPTASVAESLAATSPPPVALTDITSTPVEQPATETSPPLPEDPASIPATRVEESQPEQSLLPAAEPPPAVVMTDTPSMPAKPLPQESASEAEDISEAEEPATRLEKEQPSLQEPTPQLLPTLRVLDLVPKPQDTVVTEQPALPAEVSLLQTESPPPVPKSTTSAPPKPEKVAARTAKPTASKPIHREAWFRQRKSGEYFIQIMATGEHSALQNFIAGQHFPADVGYFRSRSQGRQWYVLVLGPYASLGQAREARDKLPAKLRRYQPWVRSIAAIQAVINDRTTSQKP